MFTPNRVFPGKMELLVRTLFINPTTLRCVSITQVSLCVCVELRLFLYMRRGISSIGRARRLQRRGTGIEARILHNEYII